MAWVKFSNKVIFKQGLVRIGSTNPFVAPDIPFVVSNSVATAGFDGYLSRSISSTPTTSEVWTYSSWVKNSFTSNVGDRKILLGFSNQNGILLDEDRIIIVDFSNNIEVQSATQIRDFTDWFHLVVAYDSTQVVASDRIKIYVNGVKITEFVDETYPALNQIFLNTSSGKLFTGNGSDLSDDAEFYGLISDMVFVDGQALLPTAFAEDNLYYGWTPIDYTGTYGNNGFRLQFGNAVDLGEDSSGNNNDFTNVGATSTADSPTSNYPTLNIMSAIIEFNYTSTPGNLTLSNDSSNFPDINIGDPAKWLGAPLSTAFESGKWYFEVEINNTVDPQVYCGLAGSDGRFSYQLNVDNDENDATWTGQLAVDEAKTYAIGRDDVNGYVYGSNGSVTSFTPSVDPGSKFMFAVDATNKKIWVGQNGSWIGATKSQIEAGTNETWTYTGEYVLPFAQMKRDPVGTQFTFRVEDSTFNYPSQIPTGFTDLGEDNIEIGPNVDQSDYFDVLTWIGDGSATRNITGLSFTPDMVITKNVTGLTTDGDPLVWVSDVGATLSMNSTQIVGGTFGNNGIITGVVPGGFSVADGSTDGEFVNQLNSVYVALCFKKKPGFFNTTIYSDNAINPIGPISTSHGLGEKPGMLIVRNLTEQSSWAVWHDFMPGGHINTMNMEDNSLPTNNGTFNSEPTSTTVEFGDEGGDGPGNGVGNDHLLISFANNNDYVKVGEIAGLSDSFGWTYVYTGFEPKAVIIKATFGLSSFDAFWNCATDANLEANEIPTDISGWPFGGQDGSSSIYGVIRMHSNGFSIRLPDRTNPDDNPATMVWIAFAKNPTRKAKARYTRIDFQ